LVKFSKGPSVSGPSSSLGIMRFFDSDTKGPKIPPIAVVGIAAALIVALMIVHAFL